MKKLLNTIPQIGKIDWVSLRPVKRGDIEVTDQIEVSPEQGIHGDHYCGKSKKRQVTLIQSEHLEAVAGLLGVDKIDPLLTRRNIIVSGVNLLAFNDKQFRIGDEVVLEMTGHCHPCSRMETNLGPGGYNAMRGHGGITTKVIKGGVIKKGDVVVFIGDAVVD